MSNPTIAAAAATGKVAEALPAQHTAAKRTAAMVTNPDDAKARKTPAPTPTKEAGPKAPAKVAKLPYATTSHSGKVASRAFSRVMTPRGGFADPESGRSPTVTGNSGCAPRCWLTTRRDRAAGARFGPHLR